MIFILEVSMDIFRDIIEFADKRPEWQSDAMRRLVIQGSLTDNDRREIMRMLKAKHGMRDDSDPVPQPQPLTAQHFTKPAIGKPATILRAIHDVLNVNALAQNQRIEFAESGVTVIYGRNASGKSGYARVLKRACRARGVEPILPNVFKHNENAPPAEAILDIVINGNSSQVIWIDGKSISDELSDIQVFDSNCVRIYVDKSNKVEYVPYGLDVFPRLVSLCKDLRNKLQAELSIIERSIQYLEMPEEEGTQVYELLSNLTYETDQSEVENLANLSSEDCERLEDLMARFSELKTSDPEVKAREIRRKIASISSFIEDIKAADLVLAEKEILEKLWDEKCAAEQVAKITRLTAFEDEPVLGSGSDPWKEMFLAAKNFSEQEAYPSHEFPYVDEGANCLLCQQPIKAKAAERLKRFKNFLIDESERLAIEKRRVFGVKKRGFKGVQLHPESKDNEILKDLKEIDGLLADLLKKYFESLRNQSQYIISACETGQWDNIPSLSQNPLKDLEKVVEKLEQEAILQENLIDPKARERLEREYIELKHRRWLAGHKENVIKNLKQRKYQQGLKQCIGDTRHKAITDFGVALIDKAVTSTLMEALAGELDNLGLSIPMKLGKKGEVGEAYHKIEIPDVKYENVILSNVLSEGEQRAVALASFLAELSIADHTCGIIFDDPVSSLDDSWMRKIGSRLVLEGSRRQVIVFTHDLPFLVELIHEGKDLGIPVECRMLRRSPDETGICYATKKEPWKAMNVNERIDELWQIRKDIMDKHQDEDDESYGRRIGDFYSLLRSAWERAIEEILFRDTINRFRNDIQTKKLKDVIIKDGDYKKIDAAMTKCSNWTNAHDTAVGYYASYPDPTELKTDLENLSAFIKEIKSRKPIS